MEPETGFVEVEDGRLFYERVGQGPAVVLIHGGMWDRRMWEDQFDPFSRKHTVVRYDARGFGRSDLPTRPYSNSSDLAAVITALGLAGPAVLGLSMGGSVALDYAVEYPEGLGALVVASCGIGGHSEWSADVVDAWEREDATPALAGALRSQLEFWTPGGQDLQADERLREVAFENLRIYEVDEDLASRVEPPVIGRLSDVRVPTLVIVGDRDVSSIHRMGDRMVAEIPGARKAVVPGDHLPNVRDPAAFNRVVLAFLAETLSPGGS